MMYFENEDYQANRLFAALGYVVFFVPLLAAPKSRLGRYAANQGLIGFLAMLAVIVAFWIVDLLLGWIPVLGWLMMVVGYLCRLAVVGAMIWHGVMCYRGEAKALPFIGTIELLH